MRKPAFCICENKDADQLRGYREADLRLCFRYIDSTIPPLPKSKISSLQPSSVTVQPGLCGTRSKNPKTGFLTTRLINNSLWIPLKKHCIISKRDGLEYKTNQIISVHYANTPMQYTAILHGCKNVHFQMKFFNMLLIFAQNIDCAYTLEPPQ